MPIAPLSLSQYVKKRSGVPLGGKGALSAMLTRSLGAKSFSEFWQYWNPIWSYYLTFYCYAPLRRFLSVSVATLLTFAISGAAHDLAVGLISGTWQPLCTLWFCLMGLAVVFTRKLNITYERRGLWLRALLNAGLIAMCLTPVWFYFHTA